MRRFWRPKKEKVFKHIAGNPMMNTIAIDAASKSGILEELQRLNINQFTTYYDLDRLSKEIIAAWGC